LEIKEMNMKRKIGILFLVVLLSVLFVTACQQTTEAPVEEEAAPAEEEAEPAEEEAEPAEEEAEPAEEEAEPAEEEEEPIRIGVLAPLSGAFAGLGEENVVGVEIAMEEIDYEICGRPVELYIEDTQIEPDVAVEKARALVNRDDVHFIVGPLSGSTSLAVKEASFEWPDVTVLPGGAANDITMRDIAPNVYRNSFAGGQPLYPLAEWAIENGYETIATIGEDYSFPWDQIGGFAYAYCQLGGKIADSYWTPIGTADYSSIIAELDPEEIDAILVAYGGTDAINFVKQFNDFGLIGQIDFLGGSSFQDPSVLAEAGELMEGTVGGSLYTSTLEHEEFLEFDAAFREKRGYPSTLFAENFYRGAKWIILATEANNCDIDDVDAWREKLQETEFVAPSGPVYFDEYHNPVQNIYLNRVVCEEGECFNETFETVEEVTQYYKFDQEEFDAALPFGRNNPSCPPEPQ
jgi:branched-chain amino acid transport system substrate-binding protein